MYLLVFRAANTFKWKLLLFLFNPSHLLSLSPNISLGERFFFPLYYSMVSYNISAQYDKVFLMKLLSNKFFSSYLVRVSYIRKPYRLISGRKKIQHAITNYNVITNKSSRFYESIIFLRRVNFYIILHASCIILYVSNIALNFILAVFSIEIFSLITYCSKQIDKVHLIGFE